MIRSPFVSSVVVLVVTAVLPDIGTAHRIVENVSGIVDIEAVLNHQHLYVGKSELFLSVGCFRMNLPSFIIPLDDEYNFFTSIFIDFSLN